MIINHNSEVISGYGDRYLPEVISGYGER